MRSLGAAGRATSERRSDGWTAIGIVLAALALESLVICAAMVKTGVTPYVVLSPRGTAPWDKIQLLWVVALLPAQVIIIAPLLWLVHLRRPPLALKCAVAATAVVGIVDQLLFLLVVLAILLFLFPPFG